MEEYEFFVLPVNQVLPFDVTKYYPTEINGVKMENYLSWMKSAWYITATGNPAASVPCDEVPTWTKLWPLPVLWKRSGRRENHPSRFRSRTFSVITLLSGDFVRIVLAGESEISALAVAMRASKIPQTPPVGPHLRIAAATCSDWSTRTILNFLPNGLSRSVRAPAFHSG